MLPTINSVDYPLVSLPPASTVKISRLSDRALSSQKFNSRKLLSIVPEDDLREVIQTGLELTTSWKIVTTHCYETGARLAEIEQPHVILLNLERAELEHSTLLAQLKANPLTRHIPTLLMTDRVRLSDWWQLTKLGIAGAISKPFDCASLGKQIAVLLRWDELRF